MPLRRVFLDTQVWVHFAEPRSLGLPALVGAERVIVVVPSVTLQELDKLKSTAKNRKVKERAVRALRAIEAADQHGTPLDGGVDVEPVLSAPLAQLDTYALNAHWADDMLVASVLAWRDAHPGEPTPALVSDDTGPGVKCRHYGVVFAAPDPVHRYEDEDEDQRTIRRLQGELSKLKAAVPEPSLAFVDECGRGPNIRIDVAPERVLDKAGLKAAIQERYPDMVADDALVEGVDLRIPAPRIRTYNDKLAVFRAYRLRHEIDLHRLEDIHRRCARLALEVRNTGSAPADDVRVILRFPDGMRLWLADDPPAEFELKPPDEPRRPRAHDFGSLAGSLPPVTRPPREPIFHPRPTGPHLRIDDTGPSIRGIGKIERVMHGVPERLPELIAFVPDSASFSIDVELHAANRPVPVTGKLNVRMVGSGEAPGGA